MIKFKGQLYTQYKAKSNLEWGEIYENCALVFPDAARIITKVFMRSSMVRWKRWVPRMPMTFEELNEMMLDPDFYAQYGCSEFGKFETTDPGYSFYDRMETVYVDGEAKRILCFVNWMVVDYIKGAPVKLGADGTQKTCPKIQLAHKFDNNQELYTVHAIISKKVNFNIVVMLKCW